MAPKGVVAAASKDLPKNIDDLLQKVTIAAIHPLEERHAPEAFDYLWSTTHTATVKLQDYRHTAFTTPNALVEASEAWSMTSSDRVQLFKKR